MKKTVVDSTMKRIGVGTLCALGAALAIGGVLGLLVLKEVIPIDAAPIAAILTNSASLFGVCYLTVRKCAKSRLPFALSLAAVFALTAFLVKAVFFPMASFAVGWYTAAPFLTAALAGVMASRKKQVRR